MAIAVFAVGYLLLFEREHTEEAPTVPTLVTAFDPSKIQAIEITYNGTNTIPVSYTHLTLPTNREV